MFRLVTLMLLIVAAVQAKEKIPIIVELFTSEGCSSCPPADSLLAELESKQPVRDVDLIVLSEHVDYWNSLGWKDPFSSAAFSDRQKFYAALFHANDIFTPQTVIDGRYPEVGSNRKNILKAIAASSESPKPALPITVTRQGDTLSIDVTPTDRGDIWIALTQARTVSHVEHGENAGRTLENVGVVRSLTKLSAGHALITIDRGWGSDLRVVAFVQDQESGRILQAVQKKI